MVIDNRYIVVNVFKKSQADGFKGAKIGDIIHFSLELKGVGADSLGRTHATYIKCENERTGNIGYCSLNILDKVLRNYEFKLA